MPRTLIRFTALLILLILMAVLWRYLAGTGFLTLERMKGWIGHIEAVQSSPWVVTDSVLVYVVTLLLALAFPLTLLVVLTGLLFGPWWGLVYATMGTLSSSAVTFWIGRLVGRETLERHGGRHRRRCRVTWVSAVSVP